jgi:hypothetical protein
LQAIFNSLGRLNILKDVQTLILDGLSVTSELVREIICEESYSVRVLSIREVQNLNERKLQQVLRYSIRPSRAANTPRLEALYLFGPKDATSVSRLPRLSRLRKYGRAALAETSPSYGGVMHVQGAQIGAKWNEMSEDSLAQQLENSGDRWYGKSGKILTKLISAEWADTILSCRGIISFDVVLCTGPRHEVPLPSANDNSTPWHRLPSAHIPPRVATYAMRGCCNCGSAPEGFSQFGQSPIENFPLLSPPPLHSPTAKFAKTPTGGSQDQRRLLVRCTECIRNRYCESCHKWWCEDCYEVPTATAQTSAPAKPWESVGATSGGQPEKNVKVHMGLCVENCLVAEMMSGAGSNGMWG